MDILEPIINWIDNKSMAQMESIPEQSKANLGSTGPLEKDPHAPKGLAQPMSPSNYQTIVSDPTASGTFFFLIYMYYIT